MFKTLNSWYFFPLGFMQQPSSPESSIGSSSPAIIFTYLFLIHSLSSAGRESRIHAAELFLSLRIHDDAQSRLPSIDILGVRVAIEFQDDEWYTHTHTSDFSLPTPIPVLSPLDYNILLYEIHL